ncbi:MAG: hypothetical protein DI553_12955 [Cutibacterium acnes]|nr:MAG: hypothetical protein DI553_12955 [Cutibacterium acnes]
MSTIDLGESESFAQRQLRTTMDVDCPAWLDFIHGGLQFQAVHHLFPRVPRHNLRKVQFMIREFCDVKVVILTTFDRDDYLFDALDAGASGFMLKNADAESLVAGLRQVADGHALLAPEVTRRVIARSVHQGGTVTGSKAEQLTAREIEVAKLVARGLSNAEIAEELVVSAATVKTHVSNCLMKCDLRDRVQLVALAYESGLIRVGEPSRD